MGWNWLWIPFHVVEACLWVGSQLSFLDYAAAVAHNPLGLVPGTITYAQTAARLGLVSSLCPSLTACGISKDPSLVRRSIFTVRVHGALDMTYGL